MGDPDPSQTYAGVGAALSQWEAMEFGLARAYSIFVGDPDGSALRDYGTGRIFRDRIAALGVEASSYFTRYPDQTHEGEFNRLIDHAVRFSERRNEIAHGIVLDVRKITFFQRMMKLMDTSVHQYVLVPPWHVLRQHDPAGMPSFAFNKNQLDGLAVKFHALERGLATFRRDLRSRQAKQPPSSSEIYTEPPQTVFREP
jgi:hypothetical protein